MPQRAYMYKDDTNHLVLMVVYDSDGDGMHPVDFFDEDGRDYVGRPLTQQNVAAYVQRLEMVDIDDAIDHFGDGVQRFVELARSQLS